jgi:hypothetical protein
MSYLPLLFIALTLSSCHAQFDEGHQELCKVVYNTAISEMRNDFYEAKNHNFNLNKINDLCLNITHIQHSDATFNIQDGALSYTKQGLYIKTMLKDACIPMAPYMTADLKIITLTDMFAHCDYFFL